MLKSNFFSKTKKLTKPFQTKNITFSMLFLNIYTGLDYFIRTTHINLIHKVLVDLINERQQDANCW